jgi:hypothetical protein
MPDTWQVSAWLDETWLELPLADPAGLAELESEIDARVARHPALGEQRQRMLDLGVALTADAVERGAVRAAVRWLPYPELEATSTATLHLFVVDRPDARPVGDELDRLGAELAQRRPTDRSDPSVERCRTPAGEALRVQVVTEADPSPGEEDVRAAVLETVQYWLPVPDAPSILLLHCATPTLGLADELVAEFDEIARHLELVR